MLNKRKSVIILIRVNVEKKIRFIVPIPLFVFKEALEAVRDVTAFFEFFTHKGSAKRGYCQRNIQDPVISQCADMCVNLISELRNYPNLRMVEVDTPEAKVYIDLF
jgi:hypothetical protein